MYYWRKADMYDFMKKYVNYFINRWYLIAGFIFLLCFFIMIGQDYRLYPGNDDVFYIKAVKECGSALQFMIWEYERWNCRYFTYFAVGLVMGKNIWLWRILNTFVLFVMVVYTSGIFKSLYHFGIKKNVVILFGVFASFALLSSGVLTQGVTWVTGSFNYLWPASALVVSFYYLFNVYINKANIRLFQVIILIPVIMFACTTEQTSLICITMYTVIVAYYGIKEKYFNKYILLLYLFAVISTVVVLSADSIQIRYAVEMKTWYPIFDDLSLFTKALNGFSYTVLFGFLCNNYSGTILLSVLLYIISKKQYNNVYTIVALIPAFYSLAYYIVRAKREWVNSSLIYNLQKFSSRCLDNNLNEPFVSVIIGTLVLLILVYFILKIKWSSFERKCLAVLFFGAALLSAFTVSFSPTIYASGERIFFVPYTMYILGVGMVFVEALKYMDMKSKKFIIIFSLYCLVGIIDVFSKVYR